MENNEKTILVLHKDGSKFYRVMGIDAEILNYLFGYQIIKNRVGFPDNAIDKVCSILDKEKISYQIVYSDKNPIIKDYGDENCYLRIFEEAHQNHQLDERIKKIIEKINEMNYKDKEIYIEKIEELIMG